MKNYLLLGVALSSLLALAGGCQKSVLDNELGQKSQIDQVVDSQTLLKNETSQQSEDALKTDEMITDEKTNEVSATSTDNTQVTNFDFYKKTCEQANGMLITINAWKGKWEACYFDDGSLCEIGSLTRDECRKGGCHEICDKQNTELEGWYDNCSGNLVRWANCAEKK